MLEAHTPTSLRIATQGDIVARAEQFDKIAADYGLRVLPWHNLGSKYPMTDADGQQLSSSVFGWSDDDECWRSLAQRSSSPTANLSRYCPEPYWATVGSRVTSRNYKHIPDIDLSNLWCKNKLGGFMIVPVHLHQGQVGLVGFLTEDGGFDFDLVVDDLTRLSWEFITSYNLVCKERKEVRPLEPLSPQEIECLTWAFHGKTDREIAEITGRSYATVRFHISKCAVKLNSVNRAQTLAKAATFGYIATLS